MAHRTVELAEQPRMGRREHDQISAGPQQLGRSLAQIATAAEEAAGSSQESQAAIKNLSGIFSETRGRAEHAMELLGLANKRHRTAATLSHGDQKLLDIALALVLDPKVLLLDEPTAGMGTEERWRMIDKVYELWERQKITVVFIEHDMDIVFKIAPVIVVLCYGRILATGAPDAIRQNPAVIEAYLGTEHHAEAAT